MFGPTNRLPTVLSKKTNYKKRILKQLYFGGVFSCADLSEKINISIPVTTRILNELVAEGFVLENGFAPSKGGRRPVTYSIRADVMYIVSVAMDQFVTRLAIMDMHNQFVVATKQEEIPLHDNAEALSLLTEKIDGFIGKSGIAKEKIVGIGIGMPGFVDVIKGINYSFLPSNNKRITTQISEQVGLPVFIDNDSSLIALAELRFGSPRSKSNVMVVNISWGVGLGLILNNELFRGDNGFAGEFSHIPLFQNNKLCSCGKRGCLETETSLLVVIEKAKEGLRAGRLSTLSPEALEHYEQAVASLVAAASKGDPFTVELFSEAGYNIGRGVAILIHILNPAVIVLSGRGAAAGKVWEAPIQQAVNEHCIPRLSANTSIQISRLGYEAELIGAASLVMENFDKEGKKVKEPVPQVEYAMRK
jgi:predicted NBD/HSP70 family sugar kinase